MLARLVLPLAAFAVVFATAAPCSAWSLSKELIRPALVAAQVEVRRCALEHVLPNGRYAVWIEVDARGRARAKLRDAPAGSTGSGRRCIAQAYEAQIYPTALEATVSWSAASPPKSTYSISWPFELRVDRYGFFAAGDPLSSGLLESPRIRPRPARLPATFFSP